MADNAFTIPVGLVLDAAGVIDGVKTLQNGIAANPLKINLAPSGGKLVLGDAQKFFDDIAAGASQIEKVEIKYRSFVDTATGQRFDVPIEAYKKLVGAQGQVIATTEKWNQTTLQAYQTQQQFVEVQSQTATLNIGKTIRETDAAYAKLSQSVDNATNSAKLFLAKSENMTGKQVENAKVIAKEVLTQSAAFKEAYGQRNIEGMRTAGEAVAKLVPQFREAEAATKRGAGAIRSWADNLTNAIKQTLAYSFSLGALRTAQNWLNDGIRYTIELNKELVNIQLLQAEGAQTAEEINALAGAFNGLAKELGATTLEVARGSVEWLRQGKTIEETTELLRTSTMLSKLGNVSAAEATEYLTSTINSYGMAANEAVGIVDKLIAVDNTSATSTKELAVALRYAAAGAKEAGVSIEELISYIGVISQTTRLNAEQIGQAMKTIFARMQDIRAGAIDEDGIGLNNVELALDRIDVKLRDGETSFRGMGEVLEDVAAKWNTLNDVEQANISKAIAGVRQRNMFVILMQNMNEALRLQSEQTTSAGLTLSRYDIYLQGVEAAQNKLTASMQTLWQGAISSGMITSLLELSTRILEVIDNVGGLRTIIVALGLTIAAVNLQSFIGLLYQAQVALYAAGGGVAGLTAALKALNLAFLTTPVGWVVAGLAVLTTALYFATDGFKTAEEKLEDLHKQLDDTVQKLNSLRDTKESILELAATIEQLRGEFALTAQESQTLTDSMNKLKELVPSLSGHFDEYGNFIVDSTINMKELTDATNEQIIAQQALLKEQANATAQADLEVFNKAFVAKKRADAGSFTQARPGGLVTITLTPEEIAKANTDYKEALDKLIPTFQRASKEYRDIILAGLTDPKIKDALIASTLDAARKAESARLTAQAKRYGETPKRSFSFETGKEVEKQLNILDDLASKYAAVDEAITKHGTTSSEAMKALQDAIGEEAELLDYLAEDGSINLEKLRQAGEDSIGDLREWLLDTSNNIAPEFRAALLNAIGDVDNTMRQFSAQGISMTREQFIGFANDASAAAWTVAQNSGIALQDSAGNLIRTQDQLVQALIQGLVTYDSIAAQLVEKNAQDIGSLLSYAQELANFWGGVSSVKPPAFVSSGGGGGGGGKSVEQERIEKEIEKLNDKKKALQDNLDEFGRYIDAQKESLKLAKEEKEFTDEMMKKQKSLAKLKSEIAILALDDSEEAKAQRLQLEEEAANLETDIAEDKEDRKYELQINALDMAQQAYEDAIEKQMDLLDDKIDKLQEEKSAINSNTGAMGSYGSALQTTAKYGQALTTLLSKGLIDISRLTDLQISKLDTFVTGLKNANYPIDLLISKARQAIIDLQTIGYIASSYGNLQFTLGQGSINSQGIPGYYHEGGAVESHHDGSFAGSLKTNEVFAKLLKGEYVATESQMADFMKNILPRIANYPSISQTGNAGDVINVDMPITVQGNMDKSVIPDIDKLTDKVIVKINNAMKKRGRVRQTSVTSI